MRKGLEAAEPARRWILDIEGSVLSTGLCVERARRGYNPHHGKSPSYYPLLVTLAQTGHVVGQLNRRGNVHDSHRGSELWQQTVRKALRRLGLQGTFEASADSAFYGTEVSHELISKATEGVLELFREWQSRPSGGDLPHHLPGRSLRIHAGWGPRHQAGVLRRTGLCSVRFRPGWSQARGKVCEGFVRANSPQVE